ncbi:hypothetical protein GLOIN_2v1763315 [Rhizophagus clarus]|uniref:hAT-like transposase RNase-H fold domain-containing protein n=1 Tax=Rhizophagus clarus TaxID=94130 RepID=A0A8H3QID6_9GLOM|nr:hypothetical protein GLOIN_2v1763315 [Rhizophagus clarus]
MEVLCEFSLTEKTLALTTDNASSIISCGKFIVEELEIGFQNLDFTHYRYVTHVLNLAVNRSLNLICESVKKWKRMEPTLNLLVANDQNVRQRYLTKFDRVNIDDTMVLLSPIERATCLLSASSYPTHGDIQFIFLSIQEHLSQYVNPRVKFSAFENESERANAKNLVLSLTEYSSSSSPLPAEITSGDDIINTQIFF